jgi:hypothetical protein
MVCRPGHGDAEQCCEHNVSTPINSAGFEVLTAVSTKMAVFWVLAPWSLVEV